jgi:hypothetical protein
MKNILKKIFFLKSNITFNGSSQYWEKRYRSGGNSGNGSYGDNSIYKSNYLNHFAKEHFISSVIEFGCGDGNQLNGFNFDNYIGLDVSSTAIKNCIDKYKADKSKSFFLYNSFCFHNPQKIINAELSISLDVIYHLIEDSVYVKYLNDLFESSKKYVIIYAWDVEGPQKGHVKHRKFSTYISENLKEWERVDYESKYPKIDGACDFFVYKKKGA